LAKPENKALGGGEVGKVEILPVAGGGGSIRSFPKSVRARGLVFLSLPVAQHFAEDDGGAKFQVFSIQFQVFRMQREL
jgi:hypothetical protein